MQAIGDGLLFSATDLNNFLSCAHLTGLDLAAARGEIVRPEPQRGQAELLAELGEQHELAYLRRLQADGHTIVPVDRRRGYQAAAAETERAMAAGAQIVYQATFFDGRWVGHADFLRRVDGALPGGRWAWHYEVEDTKLARDTRPYFLLQLAYYSEHVARVQGASARFMYVVLGSGERRAYRLADVAAYYRAVKERFVERVHAEAVATYPVPNDHCGLCVWDGACTRRRREDDHLSEVAGMTRLQTARLNEAGIPTLAALGRARDDQRPRTMAVSTFDKLRRQARLQDEQRRGGLRYELIAEALPAGRGLALLPAPSSGDVFFDMEGDPYYELGTGLEYLFGASTPDGAFHPFWGCDRAGYAFDRDRRAEKRAFEAFIDFVMARREADPAMHVYHYASYERTALQKLALRHGTREAEVDVLLREDVLVDLYRVVRQAVVVGQPSYSIKRIEEYYGKRAGDATVKAGDDSILRFEEWLARRGTARHDDGILDELARYNRYDCESTLRLRDWLLRLRDQAQAEFGGEIPFFAGKPPEAARTADPKYAELKAAIDAALPDEAGASEPLWLARQMLEYHWREDKPVWWRFHERCDSYHEEPELLLDDAECIVGLEPQGAPVQHKQSLVHSLRFPGQIHKLSAGTEVYDLATKAKAGVVREVADDEHDGRIELVRGPSLAQVPLPRGVTARGIVQSGTLVDALARFARTLLDHQESCRYRAAYDVLRGALPRFRDRPSGARVQPEHPGEDSLRRLCDALDDSYLFIQGPPGSGKTYAGARLIAGLLADGKKIGMCASSHKAIHNLLDEVEAVAVQRGLVFRGLKKGNVKDPDTVYASRHGLIGTSGAFAPGDADLFAGTAWAFAAGDMDAALDYLFIDEAGQMALPVAIATMTAARNVVLLGDPLQLSQVSHTEHPGGVGVSVLHHLLGGELKPVAPERGVLLTDSYRMHPEVCGFISDLLYEGKLQAAPGRERQRVESADLDGAGLRHRPVEHAHNTQRSLEEAALIVREIQTLLAGSITGVDGLTRPLDARDVIVVTPYNLQVRTLRMALDAAGLHGVQAGTVDKFQGREAYVVFFSTAASSPEDAPRGVGFIFDRQRFNVAVSRARALAVLVGSPALLVQSCNSVEDVRVANGVAAFVERTRELIRM